jgi:lambda repressor-like predicted transcriptional regulator
VDLVQAYSNLPEHVERLRALLDLPQAARPKRSERPPKQARKRLDVEGVAELVRAYKAGGRVKNLASQFGVHRDTVHNILKRQGVLRRPGIQPNDLIEATRLYEAGWSLARLAAEFDLSPSTINAPYARPACPFGGQALQASTWACPAAVEA